MFHLCRGLIPQFMRNANVHLQHKTRFIENHNNRWESWITAPSLYSTHFSNTQRWIFHDMNLELCDWFVYFQPITADFKPTLTPLATRPSRVLKVSLWPFANLVESFLSWKEGKMFRPSWSHVFPSTLWMLYAKILSQIPSKVSISRSSDFTYFVFFFSL